MKSCLLFLFSKNRFTIRRNLITAILALVMLAVSPVRANAYVGQDEQNKDLNFLYKAGEEGYKCFRIPAIVRTVKGTILAFAEARKNNCSDAGDIDLVVKRSEDGGKTWGKLQVVWDDDENTCGNPAPVVEQKTGKVLLLATWNLGTDHERDIISKTSTDTRRVFKLSSSDDGLTWSTAQEITSDVKQDNWTWYATGPVSGIQVQKGKYKGRLVIPCDHIEAGTKKYYSHVIFSDDRGETWKLGGRTPQDGVNESTVAELSDGKLMLNMRNFGAARNRQFSISKDGGQTWPDIVPDHTLVEPVCQASLIRFKSGKKEGLAFSNPASQTSRRRMTVRISYDDGQTWPMGKVIHHGPSAYSNLLAMPNGKFACFYEAGYEKPYEGIVYEEVAISDLTMNYE
jgi:sialidase-1